MPPRSKPINIVIDVDRSKSPTDSESLAKEFAKCLISDDVERWAAEVRSIIAASRRRPSVESVLANASLRSENVSFLSLLKQVEYRGESE